MWHFYSVESESLSYLLSCHGNAFIHHPRFVRQALMFAVSMVILSVPSQLLLSDLQDEILECKTWLEGNKTLQKKYSNVYFWAVKIFP